MDFLQIFVLSLVEGITEFLPISSTGHLILVSDLLNVTETNFSKSFEIVIQLGAIMAVVGIYTKKVLQNLKLIPILLTAFLPSAFLGFLFYDFIKSSLLGNESVTVLMLFVGGVLIILFEKFYRKTTHQTVNLEKVNFMQALLVGIGQSFSMVPGVSRAAATILSGMATGMDRKTSVEFSFLLAVPTMFAATFLDLYKSDFNFSQTEYLQLVLGVIISFVTAYLAIKTLLKFVNTNSFVIFGVYRIILAVVFYFLFLN